MQWNCRYKSRKQESTPQAKRPADTRTKTNMVHSKGAKTETPQQEDPCTFLLSDSVEDDKISLVRVQDEGSKSQTALVEIAGVPAHGIVDAGADITIMGLELFKKVATIAKLNKRQFKKADKVPQPYDQCQFKLDG